MSMQGYGTAPSRNPGRAAGAPPSRSKSPKPTPIIAGAMKGKKKR